MKHYPKYPDILDFDSEEEYEDACEVYEQAESEYEDACVEEYYEKLYS